MKYVILPLLTGIYLLHRVVSRPLKSVMALTPARFLFGQHLKRTLKTAITIAPRTCHSCGARSQNLDHPLTDRTPEKCQATTQGTALKSSNRTQQNSSNPRTTDYSATPAPMKNPNPVFPSPRFPPIRTSYGTTEQRTRDTSREVVRARRGSRRDRRCRVEIVRERERREPRGQRVGRQVGDVRRRGTGRAERPRGS